MTLDINENKTILVGELTRQTVMDISNKRISQMISLPTLEINLQQLTRIDTAGLAWLFYLLEQGSATGCSLFFIHVPTQLKKLISLSGVDGFLPVDIHQ